jgi:hypothetical protein
MPAAFVMVLQGPHVQLMRLAPVMLVLVMGGLLMFAAFARERQGPHVQLMKHALVMRVFAVEQLICAAHAMALVQLLVTKTVTAPTIHVSAPQDTLEVQVHAHIQHVQELNLLHMFFQLVIAPLPLSVLPTTLFLGLPSKLEHAVNRQRQNAPIYVPWDMVRMLPGLHAFAHRQRPVRQLLIARPTAAGIFAGLMGEAVLLGKHAAVPLPAHLVLVRPVCQMVLLPVPGMFAVTMMRITAVHAEEL